MFCAHLTVLQGTPHLPSNDASSTLGWTKLQARPRWACCAPIAGLPLRASGGAGGDSFPHKPRDVVPRRQPSAREVSEIYYFNSNRFGRALAGAWLVAAPALPPWRQPHPAQPPLLVAELRLTRTRRLRTSVTWLCSCWYAAADLLHRDYVPCRRRHPQTRCPPPGTGTVGTGRSSGEEQPPVTSSTRQRRYATPTGMAQIANSTPRRTHPHSSHPTHRIPCTSLHLAARRPRHRRQSRFLETKSAFTLTCPVLHNRSWRTSS